MIVNLKGKLMLGTAVLAALGSAGAACATEGGGTIYPIGADTVAPGILPPKPGLYWQHYSAYYRAKQTNDGVGEPRPVPNFDLQIIGNAERLLYVTDKKVAGGQVVFQTIIPHADVRLRSGNVRQHKYQLGDVSVGGFLAWHSPKLHGWIGPNIYFPTGGYDVGEPANIGRNITTVSLQGGITYLPTPKIEVGVKGYLAANGTNRVNRYASGDELAFDYLAAYRISPKTKVGIQGYYYDQISDDRLAGTVVPGGNQGRAFAIGPMLASSIGKVQFAVKYQGEIMSRNRAQGDRFWLQTSIAL